MRATLCGVSVKNEQEARQLIAEVEARYSEDVKRIDHRVSHFHALPETDPLLPDPYKLRYPVQSDVPRRIHTQLKARLTENHFILSATSHGGADAKSAAARWAEVKNAEFRQAERRMGDSIQGQLADDLIIKKYGVLHWLLADHLWDPVAKTGATEKRERMKADRGLWHIECIDPRGFMPVPDRSMRNGLGLTVLHREVGLLDYKNANGHNGKVRALSQISSVPLGEEQDAPHDGLPSSSGYNKKVDLYQIWDHNGWSEWIKDGPSMTGQEGAEHPYEMPPFSIAAAAQVHNPDFVLRYEPALTGVYRQKEMIDYYNALFFATAEYGMLPYWYLEATGTGVPMLDDNGRLQLFDRKSVSTTQIPKGYTLKRLDFEISDSFVRMGDMLQQAFRESWPSTGQAEFDKNTQPWAIRLQQAQESVEPGLYLANITNTIDDCLNNMLLVESKDDVVTEAPAAWGYTPEGKVDYSRTVKAPIGSELEGIRASVAISNMSSAERISAIEAGRTLMADPNVPLTTEAFLREYMHDPRPDETMLAYDEEVEWKSKIKPHVLNTLFMERWGHIVSMGPNGQWIGPEGQPVDEMAALEAAGYDIQGTGGAPAQQGQQPEPQHPALPGLNTPGTMPLRGQNG